MFIVTIVAGGRTPAGCHVRRSFHRSSGEWRTSHPAGVWPSLYSYSINIVLLTEDRVLLTEDRFLSHCLNRFEPDVETCLVSEVIPTYAIQSHCSTIVFVQ
jgi:hypothetical protein